MIEFLSHRGFWETSDEKNSLKAITKSFDRGFGIETDIRDFNGELVISHDIANSESILLTEVFEQYKNYNVPLALNIKADGLQKKLNDLLNDFEITNYFVFDMSVPDTLQYLKMNINTFLRQSEYEKDLSMFTGYDGIWLDCFESLWFEEKIIISHLSNQKKICFVSPELHHRNEVELWQFLKESKIYQQKGILLCTDKPLEAQKFFS